MSITILEKLDCLTLHELIIKLNISIQSLVNIRTSSTFIILLDLSRTKTADDRYPKSNYKTGNKQTRKLLTDPDT